MRVTGSEFRQQTSLIADVIADHAQNPIVMDLKSFDVLMYCTCSWSTSHARPRKEATKLHSIHVAEEILRKLNGDN